MARSIWSGTISFGLISIPIKLFTAVRHKGVSFNQLDDRNMSRIGYQKVVGGRRPGRSRRAHRQRASRSPRAAT
jgi:non-homologous end joining protein Ku